MILAEWIVTATDAELEQASRTGAACACGRCRACYAWRLSVSSRLGLIDSADGSRWDAIRSVVSSQLEAATLAKPYKEVAA